MLTLLKVSIIARTITLNELQGEVNLGKKIFEGNQEYVIDKALAVQISKIKYDDLFDRSKLAAIVDDHDLIIAVDQKVELTADQLGEISKYFNILSKEEIKSDYPVRFLNIFNYVPITKQEVFDLLDEQLYNAKLILGDLSWMNEVPNYLISTFDCIDHGDKSLINSHIDEWIKHHCPTTHYRNNTDLANLVLFGMFPPIESISDSYRLHAPRHHDQIGYFSKLLRTDPDNILKNSVELLGDRIPSRGVSKDFIAEIISTCNYILYRYYNDGDNTTELDQANFIPACNLYASLDNLDFKYQKLLCNYLKQGYDVIKNKYPDQVQYLSLGHQFEYISKQSEKDRGLFLGFGFEEPPINGAVIILCLLMYSDGWKDSTSFSDVEVMDLRRKDTLIQYLSNQY